MHGAVEFAINRQVRSAIRELGSKSFVNLYSKPRLVAGKHHSVSKSVGVRKYPIRSFRMSHVLLNSEVVNTQIKMQSSGHTNWAEICGAV